MILKENFAMTKTYDPNIIGDRFDQEKLDSLPLFKQMKENEPIKYADFIDRIKKLPASYGIAVNAMIYYDGAKVASELGLESLMFFNEDLILTCLDAFEGGIKLVDPERSAREFNRPLTVLNRMAPIVEAMEAENAGREDAIKDAKTKMEVDLRNKKQELKADKSYSRNPFKRWAHRRSEMKKFEAAEKENYAKFCREQKEQGTKYTEKINQYYDAKANGSLIKGGAWVEEMERFAESYERQQHLDTLAKTPLTQESRDYEDAQAIQKQNLDTLVKALQTQGARDYEDAQAIQKQNLDTLVKALQTQGARDYEDAQAIQKQILDTLVKAQQTQEARDYEDAQAAIKKHLDLSRQIPTERQERGSVNKGSSQKTMTAPIREIPEKDEL